MKPILILAALMAAALVQPASAQPAEPAATPASACTRPAAPAPVDGATATIEQMKAANAAAAGFMTASDSYQTCILAELAEKKKAAKKAKTKVDPAIESAIDADIKANQTDKVTTGEAYNGAVRAYKAAHPPT